MKFCVVGCSYRTAPISVRERLSFSQDQLPAALASLRQLPQVSECMLLSTCNRVEVYLVTPEPEQAANETRRLIARDRAVELEEIEQLLYCHCDDEALKHIFRVTSSLDAMVVGEAQIMGQVKRAFTVAREQGTVGPLLGRCMDRAFTIAKRVRSETDVARHPASLSSVAVDLAARIFEDLSSAAVLVVGAGEMAELALTHLQAQSASRIRVLNRSPERARALAERVAGVAVPFDSLGHQLEWADIVITSTGSQQPLIDKRLLTPLMKRRRQKPLFIVDLAVPRDVSEDARGVGNLYLFDLDDLEQVVAENLRARRREAKTAEKMILSEVGGFGAWIKSRDVVPVIRQMRAHFVAVAREEARRAARRLRLDSPEQQDALDRLADAIVKKLLHDPTIALKRAAADPLATDLGDATRQLFGLHPGDVPPTERQVSEEVSTVESGTYKAIEQLEETT